MQQRQAELITNIRQRGDVKTTNNARGVGRSKQPAVVRFLLTWAVNLVLHCPVDLGSADTGRRTLRRNFACLRQSSSLETMRELLNEEPPRES